MARNISLAFAALLVGAGCTDLQSQDLKTAGMSAHAIVGADGTGASNVSVTLNVDNNVTDYVQLTPGDALVATVAAKSQTLASSSVLGIVTYSTGFTSADAVGTQYTLALNRSTGNTSAPSSTCTMPAPFTLSAPTSSSSFARASQDIVVTYGGSGQSDPLSWTLSGTCFQLASNSVSSDNGSFTIPKGTLVTLQGSTAQNCQATLTMSRTRQGSLDPAYFGGSISAQQQRSVSFTSTP
jgi:hypothetical protein